MKLLITTQTVDARDPVLGFFVRWIEEFAKQCEQVTIICLRAGEHQLPSHVRVYALGEGNRLTRAYKLLIQAWRLRSDYDAVFVHMNPEYVVAAGWLWRLLDKKITLWYTHKTVSIKLRIAEKFSHIVITASKESFRLLSKKVQVMGHGIDTDFFTSDRGTRGDEVLSAGRLSPTKRHDLVLRALQYTHRDTWIAGEGPEFDRLERLSKELQVSARVHFLGARNQTEMRELYRRCGVLAHTSETGSLDKVVLEALLCGMPVVSTSEAFKELLQPHGLFVAQAEPKVLAGAIEQALGKDMAALTQEIRLRHSLQNLIPAILKVLHG